MLCGPVCFVRESVLVTIWQSFENDVEGESYGLSISSCLATIAIVTWVLVFIVMVDVIWPPVRVRSDYAEPYQ